MKGNTFLDPLRDLERGSSINLPLMAFFYLVRRLSVCSRFFSFFIIFLMF